MPHSAASDLGLHCLPITLLWVSRLQWVNCVEVLWPIQPIRVMSGMVSLPNPTFFWVGLVPYTVNQYVYTFFCQKQTTALLE